MIYVCVPTYNSLEYLRVLVTGLRKNTKVGWDLMVHDNGSTDGTEEWLKSMGINYTRSETNLGFAGVNQALKKLPIGLGVQAMIFNTDMYPLPGWDEAIEKQAMEFWKAEIRKFTISSCLIEPGGDNPEYNIFYSGHDTATFHESRLLGTFLREKDKAFKKENTVQYSHPIAISTLMLEEMGYLDESYFPGWAVDHDIAASAYSKGCRNFLMLGSSRVYHFSSKTFSKLPTEVRNRSGQDIFLKKWGITVEEFRKRLGVTTPYRQVGENVLD